MGLDRYNQKRDFNKTAEPSGKVKKGGPELIFVVQKHNASRLHYDFRLEMEGVLKSWAVPKGPSLNPQDKRLAVMVEDHPYVYKDFEGSIPKGEYGGGEVIVWDNGTYEPADKLNAGQSAEQALLDGLAKGRLSIVLHGKKLKGQFALVQMKGRGENNWLLVKHGDKYANETDILKKNKSVVSKYTVENISDSGVVYGQNRHQTSDNRRQTVRTATKKTLEKKTRSKKPSAKKSGATKAATKKAASKKATSKKSEVKESETKKTEAKKTATKKASSKKAASDEQELKVEQHKVKLTSQDKIYWAADNITKGEFVNYYASMAKLMLPYLKDRPQSMHRFPNGADKPGFYQKDVEPKNMPEYVRTEQVLAESTGKLVDYIVCDNKATLVYMANLGCIEIHPWNSRLAHPAKPDWLVIDLDPEDIDFKEVVKTAQATKKVFDQLDLPCYVKTSGSTGIHVCVPLGGKYEFDVARNFAELVANRVNQILPDITSVERSPSKRKKKVYLDYLQNSIGQTLAAPYSVRPKPGATVSTPLEWKEVTAKLNPKNFTIKNIMKRVKAKGDLWKPVLGKGVDLEKVLKKVSKD